MKKLLFLNFLRPFPELLGQYGAMVFGTKVMDIILLLLLLIKSKGFLRLRFVIFIFICTSILLLIIGASTFVSGLGYTSLSWGFIWGNKTTILWTSRNINPSMFK